MKPFHAATLSLKFTYANTSRVSRPNVSDGDSAHEIDVYRWVDNTRATIYERAGCTALASLISLPRRLLHPREGGRERELQASREKMRIDRKASAVDIEADPPPETSVRKVTMLVNGEAVFAVRGKPSYSYHPAISHDGVYASARTRPERSSAFHAGLAAGTEDSLTSRPAALM